jgi:hypothetical protein
MIRVNIVDDKKEIVVDTCWRIYAGKTGDALKKIGRSISRDKER